MIRKSLVALSVLGIPLALALSAGASNWMMGNTIISSTNGANKVQKVTDAGSLWLVDENGESAPGFTNYWGYHDNNVKSPSQGRIKSGCAFLDTCNNGPIGTGLVDGFFECADVTNWCTTMSPNCQGSASTSYANCVAFLSEWTNNVWGWGCGGFGADLTCSSNP